MSGKPEFSENKSKFDMKAHNIIKSVLALSLAVVAVSSCQEKIGGSGFVKGEAVRFSIGTDVTDTKAAYSGQGTTTIERINWEPGDLIRIYCGAVSEPEEKFADYVVTEIVSNEGAVSKARIGHTSLGQLGLRWGEGPHTFYAVYPSPEDDGSIATGISINPYANGGTKSTVSQSIEGHIVRAELPAAQAVIGSITTSEDDATLKIAAPDLKNMLMTAKSNTYTEASGITDEVFLSFIPLTTAVQFTITNQTGKNIKVKSVSLISGNGKATAPAINGAFNVDIDNSLRPAPINLGASTITYSRDYPSCMRDASLETTVDLSLRTSTISFDSPVPLAYDAEAADAGKLTFTFFLTPTCNFDDITFKIVMTDSDGSNTRWMSTKLGYTDGSGVLFPRFKKTTVRGIMVPEGAQWTVKYGPIVNPWKPTGDTPIDPMPIVDENTTFVTSWDTETGIDEELKLKPNIVPPHVLPEVFSVSASEKVYFSKGNLFYDGSNGRFESNQYDYRTYVGKACCINGVVSSNGTPLENWGLFGWSTASTSYGMSTSIENGDYSGDFLDWGKLFDPSSKWFTLSKDQWSYLLFTRMVNGGTGEGKSYKRTTITLENASTIYGFIIAPDNYLSDLTATYSWTEYKAAESAGCMFLPAVGVRDGSNVSVTGDSGFYWSSTRHDSNRAYSILFENAPLSSYSVYRYRGCSVRLVTLAN